MLALLLGKLELPLFVAHSASNAIGLNVAFPSSCESHVRVSVWMRIPFPNPGVLGDVGERALRALKDSMPLRRCGGGRAEPMVMMRFRVSEEDSSSSDFFMKR